MTVGFTLVEVLVVTGILVLLMAFLLPTLGRLREQSQTVQCLHNLRGIGGTLLTAIQERPEGPVFRPWYAGDKGDFWNSWLISEGYVNREELRKLSCPGVPYPENISGKHYGIHMGDANNLMAYYDESGNKVANGYQIRLPAIDKPASTIFMADSVRNTGEQSIRIFRSDSASFSSGAFHARHSGGVNVFFFDGHAETARSARLYELGVRRVYQNKNSGELEAYTLPKPN